MPAIIEDRTFFKIGSDGGLLVEPVSMTMMEMSPGERCEIVVDLSDRASAELLVIFEDEIDAEEEGLISGLQSIFNETNVPATKWSLKLHADEDGCETAFGQTVSGQAWFLA
ncbi:hypothetical protein [uncultured Roseibium sp.]|uniref:hypothetical protein n=1 Tax=uncultured Roseibium sp. TaxID=1936171 RepID=UPI0026332B84|nr:hypothetical protein [uncultured Roseibium sp.]